MEADSILTVMTKRRGRIGAIAKGVRKQNSRLRGGVQVFTHNDMLLYQGRSLDIVTQSECIEAFGELHEDMVAMTAAGYWSELVEALVPEGEQDASLFQLVLAGFHLLCLAANATVVRGLEIKLLSQLGYSPVLDRCVSCGRALSQGFEPAFSTNLGGVVCSSCIGAPGSYEIKRFSHEGIRVWQQLIKMDLSKIRRLKVTGEALAVLEEILEAFITVQVGRSLKSKPVLKSMQL